MLYYTEVDLSSYEIPGETTLNIYISGCQNRLMSLEMFSKLEV